MGRAECIGSSCWSGGPKIDEYANSFQSKDSVMGGHCDHL